MNAEFDPELEKNIREIVVKVAEDEEVEDYEIETSPGSEKGDGYIGVITSACVRGSNKTLHLMVKSALSNPVIRKMSPIRNIFLREILFYDTIYPAFRHFQQSKNTLSPFTAIARCYKTNSTEFSESLVLENLRESNYTLWDRKQPMDDQHLRLVLAEYGKYHAVSYAMKDQARAEYEKLTEQLHTNNMSEEFIKLMMPMFKGLVEKAKELLKGPDEREMLERFTKMGDEIEEFFAESSRRRREKVDLYSVLVHGDCWCNNMMFKYNNPFDNRTPTDCKLLDWQVIEENSPIYDISYYFYTASAGSPTHLTNYLTYLRHYYDSLASALAQLGSDASVLIPYAVVEEHWRKYSRFGLIMGLMVIKVMLTEKEEVVRAQEEMSKSDDAALADYFKYISKNEEEYDRRVKMLIVHFYENDLI